MIYNFFQSLKFICSCP